MNRREFLRMLGLGAGVVTAGGAPAVAAVAVASQARQPMRAKIERGSGGHLDDHMLIAEFINQHS